MKLKKKILSHTDSVESDVLQLICISWRLIISDSEGHLHAL